MRKTFIGGNWKCNGTKKSVTMLVNSLNNSRNYFNKIDLIVAPTALHIDYVKNNLKSEYKIAVQNIWSGKNQGAYTGELTADIVKDFGIDWVILGHSERRHKVANENNILLFDKVKVALKNNLNVIYCIGETLTEKNINQTLNVCRNQLDLLARKLKYQDWKNIVIAYEPVWAIGTGQNASPEDAEIVHSFIRKNLEDNIGDIANNIRIIYGGSVNPSNCNKLIQKSNIDGFLIGSCSLNNSFVTIIDETVKYSNI